MRTKLGWVATVLGAALALAGLALAVVLGPDSRFTTGPHAVDTDGVAIVTQPGVVTWKGLQIDVLAEVPVNKPIFVGVGNSVDVQSYVRRTSRLEVTSFSTPWNVKTRQVKGIASLPAAPTALDWWIAGSAGLGGASVSATLPDSTSSVAILAVGATNLSGLKVTFGYGIKGGFAIGLSALLVGLGLAWGGLQLRRGAHLFEPVAVEDDDVEYLYVFVDEHGVEHEISAAEAERLEAGGTVTVTEHDETPDSDAPADLGEEGVEPEPEEAVEPGPVPTPPHDRVGSAPTAADIVAETAQPDPEARPQPAPEPASEAEPPEATYVYVDDDGVEHEITAEEAERLAAEDGLEIVDEEPEEGGTR